MGAASFIHFLKAVFPKNHYLCTNNRLVYRLVKLNNDD